MDPEHIAEEFKRRAQYAAWFDLDADIPSDLFAAADRRADVEDLTGQAQREASVFTFNNRLDLDRDIVRQRTQSHG
jgi:hypothetical protein